MTEPTQQFVEGRCKHTDCSEHEKRLGKVENITSNLQSLMESVDAKVDKILEKVNRIDILEVKHTNQQDELSRAYKKIDSLEKEHDQEIAALHKNLDTLSVESRAFHNETKGMAKMAWYLWSGIGATTFLLLIKVLFFTASSIKIGM